MLRIKTTTPTNGPSIIVDAQTDCGVSSNWLLLILLLIGQVIQTLILEVLLVVDWIVVKFI